MTPSIQHSFFYTAFSSLSQQLASGPLCFIAKLGLFSGSLVQEKGEDGRLRTTLGCYNGLVWKKCSRDNCLNCPASARIMSSVDIMAYLKCPLGSPFFERSKLKSIFYLPWIWRKLDLRYRHKRLPAFPFHHLDKKRSKQEKKREREVSIGKLKSNRPISIF